MAMVEWLAAPSDGDCAAVAAFVSAFWREVIDGEPDYPAAELAAEIRGAPRHRTTHIAVALDERTPVGAAQLVIDDVEGRRNQSWLKFLIVEPSHRRRGTGTALLGAVRERCRREGRARLRTSAPTTHAAGAAFARTNGASAGLVNEQNRLHVGELDRRLLEGWVRRARERGAGYSLLAFDGICPDELLPAFARVVPVMNTAPRSGSTEDIAPTPEQVREGMESVLRQGNQAWTVCVRHDATGELVGYTELGFWPHRPWLAFQGDTGVHPDHRERGLGRWIKAANALRLLDERPAVEQVQTWNAGVNAPMLSINRSMGFRPIAEWQEWELEL